MRFARLALVIVGAGVFAAACSKTTRLEDPGPSPGCTPPTAGNTAVDFTTTNATAAIGHIAAFRILEGTTAVYCTTALVPASGSLHFAGNAPDPAVGELRAELVLNSGAEAVFGPGDQHYSFPPLNVTGDYCTDQNFWKIAFDAIATTQSAISWQPGTACPGGPTW